MKNEECIIKLYIRVIREKPKMRSMKKSPLVYTLIKRNSVCTSKFIWYMLYGIMKRESPNEVISWHQLVVDCEKWSVGRHR